jgi:hypothetical protein
MRKKDNLRVFTLVLNRAEALEWPMRTGLCCVVPLACIIACGACDAVFPETTKTAVADVEVTIADSGRAGSKDGEPGATSDSKGAVSDATNDDVAVDSTPVDRSDGAANEVTAAPPCNPPCAKGFACLASTCIKQPSNAAFCNGLPTAVRLVMFGYDERVEPSQCVPCTAVKPGMIATYTLLDEAGAKRVDDMAPIPYGGELLLTVGVLGESLYLKVENVWQAGCTKARAAWLDNPVLVQSP